MSGSAITGDATISSNLKKEERFCDLSNEFLLKLYDLHGDELPPELKRYIEDRIPILGKYAKQ
jgi:hypothetical protein